LSNKKNCFACFVIPKNYYTWK